MSNRWTIKQLDETDDLTFAMCILSERREGLNQYAPLAKKIQSAFRALGELRDFCRDNKHYRDGIISEAEAIFRAVERKYTIEDIKNCIEEDNMRLPDLRGLTPEQVYADREIMDRIIERADESDCRDWDELECAIENGIRVVLEARKGAQDE